MFVEYGDPIFGYSTRIKPYLAAIWQYLQDTQPDKRVWTLFKIQDIANHQLANYILSVAFNPQNQGE